MRNSLYCNSPGIAEASWKLANNQLILRAGNLSDEFIRILIYYIVVNVFFSLLGKTNTLVIFGKILMPINL